MVENIRSSQQPVKVPVSTEAPGQVQSDTESGQESSLQELQRELALHAQIIRKQQLLLERCVMIMDNLVNTMEKIKSPQAERPGISNPRTH